MKRVSKMDVHRVEGRNISNCEWIFNRIEQSDDYEGYMKSDED